MSKVKLVELLDGCNDWGSFKSKLEKFNVDDRILKVKDTSAGLIFEEFCKLYFKYSPVYSKTYSKVWLFKEVPESVKEKLNLTSVEHGVDLILKSKDNKLYAVQCKFKNNEESKLNWSSDKIANLFGYCSKADGFIVFSNCSKIDNVSKTRSSDFTFINIADLLDIDSETFKLFNAKVNKLNYSRNLFEPLDHQEKAISECLLWFNEADENRGQLILPCGAGKTLIGLWLKERLFSKKTLVLVPSLALLRQTKNEWSKQKREEYDYLCVCSEKDIDKQSQDGIVSHTYELGGNVSTDPTEIQNFITSKNNYVIFSTYQSLPSIIKAIENIDFEFEYAFCDEAHKTAGVNKGIFSLIHNNKKIPIKRRLYTTATPRIVKESIKKKLNQDHNYTHDMGDSSIYGEEFYRMTFKEAINNNILVDYKILGIGVSDREISQYIKERRYIDKKLSLDEVANNYALNYVMKNYKANHALTFHSRVKYAEDFSERHSIMFNNIKCFSVNGSQPTGTRNKNLNLFKKAEKGVISNARCLTEGVDVPAIDLVYFSDPKNSKVDIVQAVGRALRKKEGKKMGYIVVPLFHNRKLELENNIEEGSFKNLLQVVRAICDQDERLQDEINSIAFSKGKKSRKPKFQIIIENNFDNILELKGFEEKLKNSIFDQIIEKTSGNWDIKFLELKKWLQEFKKYPSKDENLDLYYWVSKQRRSKKDISLTQRKKLNSIKFIWDIKTHKWELMMTELEKYAEEFDVVPDKDNSSKNLVRWVKYQKTYLTKSELPEFMNKEMIERFKKTYNGFKEKWDLSFDQLLEWKKINYGKWPQYDRKSTKTIESKLYVFCQTIRKRYRQNELSDKWFEKFASIDFNFAGRKDNWEIFLKEAILTSKKGKISSYKGNDYKYYNWINRNYQKYIDNELNRRQKQLFDSSGLLTYSKENFSSWNDRYLELKNYINKHGKVPTYHENKYHNSWYQSQLNGLRKNSLSGEKKELMIKIIPTFLEKKKGMSLVQKKWDEKWELKYKELIEFRRINPNQWPKFRTKLGNWINAQIAAYKGYHSGGKRNKLEDWRVKKLNKIDSLWYEKRIK